MDLFKALVLSQHDGHVHATIQDVQRAGLPEGDVLVSVAYSSLNYKDGLAVTGQGRVVRTYPMVPGIDLAGTVVESRSADFHPGQPVILTGWGVGETHWGGYAQMARVKSDWLVPLPPGMTLQQAMGIGTAGLTAMLCVMALEEHGLAPGGRDVIVTGASGGVGSIAVAILAHLGYTVVASSGRTLSHNFLRGLGAQRVIDRDTLSTPSSRPLESEHWGGAVDSVGGETLAALLRSMAYGSSVAACGLAGGTALPTTVFPFILRGVNLLGIDSVMATTERRTRAWARLVHDLPAEALAQITHVVPLKEVPNLAQAILKGQVRGRAIVDVNAL